MGLRLAVTVLLGLVLAPGTSRADVATELKAFLGDRTGKIVARDQAAGDKLYVFDLTTGQLTKLSEDINCKGPLIAADGKRVVYHQNGTIYIRTIGSSAKVKVTTGYDPHWWVDSNGDEWIYYTTQGSFSDEKRKLWWPNNNGVKTYRIRLSDSQNEWLWDWKGSGGPSKDGLFIGAGYATMVLYDTAAKQANLLYNKQQGCNASMYPGSGKYYLMHLELPHDTFCYRDKSDNRVWFVNKPAGTGEWQNPEWSSDPDYATATAKDANTYYSAWVVKLSDIDGKTGKIKSGAKGMLEVLSTAGSHDWAEPYLWVGGTAPPPPTPKLALSPTSLSFTAEEDGSNPGAKQVSVSNAGGGTLAAVSTQTTYGSGSGWLKVAASGSGNSQVLANSVQISGLAPNTYAATVKVSASGATASPQSYSVSLTITAKAPPPANQPALALSPTSLSFTAQQGSDPADQVVSVSNSSDGTLAAVTPVVTYVNGAGWLTVTAGGSGNSQSVTNSVSVAGLTADTYTATVSVAASGAANSPQSYAISLTVTEQPTSTADGGPPPGLADSGAGVPMGDASSALPDGGTARGLNPSETLVGGCRLAPTSTGPGGSLPLALLLLALALLARRRV